MIKRWPHQKKRASKVDRYLFVYSLLTVLFISKTFVYNDMILIDKMILLLIPLFIFYGIILFVKEG